MSEVTVLYSRRHKLFPVLCKHDCWCHQVHWRHSAFPAQFRIVPYETYNAFSNHCVGSCPDIAKKANQTTKTIAWRWRYSFPETFAAGILLLTVSHGGLLAVADIRKILFAQLRFIIVQSREKEPFHSLMNKPVWIKMTKYIHVNKTIFIS